MNSILVVILASVATFAVTNIDDLVLLTLFFAQRVPGRIVVIGQCLGFAGIVALSLVGFSAAVAGSHAGIRFLGLLPLALGLKQLVRMRRAEWKSGTRATGVLGIAAVTLANGADNIGVYVPFFVINHARLWLVLVVYAALVLLWCLVGKWLASHTLVLRSVDRYGHLLVPSVFIGLGIYILWAG
jgi:cadmium resistance protein CadD (predicted permease)